MIRLDGVTKRYGEAGPAAVDALTLDVPEGDTCVLVGPSGCGKTTTMRLINRLIEPSAGRIFVAGRDVTQGDPVQLRRGIGYVIQQVGLFPHLSVADNIATVPRLLGWNKPRIAARIDMLLALVGLPPELYRGRYPRQLSGGQRQRVGVARALAADPPVLLMDEPFGALDPITRLALQDEFLGILRSLRKTVVLVTHDIDEAIRLGDRIALMKDGRLLQYDTPDRLLARPVDAFTAAFVGADRALKRLSLVTAAATAGPAEPGAAPTLSGALSLKDALSHMLALGVERVHVADEAGQVSGSLSIRAIRRRASAADQAD